MPGPPSSRDSTPPRQSTPDMEVMSSTTSGSRQEMPFGRATSSERSTSSNHSTPSRRSVLSSHTSPRTPRSTPSRQILPATTTTTSTSPPPGPLPPPAGHAALYLTVSEFGGNDRFIEPGMSRTAMRHCSIAVRHDPYVDKFDVHYLRGGPGPGMHMTLYTVRTCPNPRSGEPGLLAMDFLGWIPRQRTRELESLVGTVAEHVSRSRAAWNSQSWVVECLGKMLEAGLVTNRQMQKATEKLEQALNLPYTENYPNRYRCFPGSQ